jgi:hypothetical protein
MMREIAEVIDWVVGVEGAETEGSYAYGRLVNSSASRGSALGGGPLVRPPHSITSILSELPLSIRDELSKVRLSADRVHTWAHLAVSRTDVALFAAELSVNAGDDALHETADLLWEAVLAAQPHATTASTQRSAVDLAHRVHRSRWRTSLWRTRAKPSVFRLGSKSWRTNWRSWLYLVTAVVSGWRA